MRLDATHRAWLITTAAMTVASTAGYILYALTVDGGPRGDTPVGLMFGTAAAAMILFAGFLGARKKLLLLRVGSVTWWMRGHLWLGALSLPMVLFHAAFAFGGPLTTALMVLMLIVVFTGILGAALQHAMPRLIAAEIPHEPTYEQLQRLRMDLRRDAYEKVAGVCGAIAQARQEAEAIHGCFGTAPKEPRKVTAVEGDEALEGLYLTRVLPYLRGATDGASPLSNATRADFAFGDVRTRLDPSRHETLDDLAAICNRARQCDAQVRLQRWLHGWLLLHVPLSMALLALMLVHAVTALYY